MKAKNAKFAIAPKGVYNDVTQNKKYEIIKHYKNKQGITIGFEILDNVGFKLTCSVESCCHVCEKSWILRNK